MQTKQIKNQKPISLDVHLKYRCPNNDCGYEHWLSLLETQTKNFKVVCDCGMVFKPKTIDKIKVLYKKKLTKNQASKSIETASDNIDINMLKIATRSLVDLGFSQQEATNLLEKAYAKQPTNDLSLLIKNTLLEIKNYG